MTPQRAFATHQLKTLGCLNRGVCELHSAGVGDLGISWQNN